MTSDVLTMLRERLADCEADAERLRAAIRAVEERDRLTIVTPVLPKPAAPRRKRQSTAAAKATRRDAVDHLLKTVAEQPEG